MLDKFLDLLWKCKPLFKAFVWVDYTIRFKRFPKFIETTSVRDLLRINGLLFGFYSNRYFHGEKPEEYYCKP